jgi:hypothetical protein
MGGGASFWRCRLVLENNLHGQEETGTTENWRTFDIGAGCPWQRGSRRLCSCSLSGGTPGRIGFQRAFHRAANPTDFGVYFQTCIHHVIGAESFPDDAPRLCS